MQQNFYVSVTGRDEWSGQTPDTPFATLQKACRVARQTPGSCTVWVRGGIYPLPQQLELTEDDSGLTLAAYPGEQPCLTGTVEFYPVWKQWKEVSGAWVSRVPVGLWADLLFVDGIAQIPARYPNAVLNAVPLEGAATAEQIRRRAGQWKNPATGHLRALHAYGWGGNDYIITGKDARTSTGLKLDWVGDNNRGAEFMDTALVAEGILEELDSPGEWFYDAEQGLLYFMPPVGLNIEKSGHRFEFAVNDEVLSLKGTSSENPIQNITLCGLHFAAGARTLFSGRPYVPLQRGDWAVAKSGFVHIQNACAVTLRDLCFENIGGNAVFFDGYNQHHIVERCSFLHTGASCIQLVGQAESLWQPGYWPHSKYPNHPVHPTDVTQPNCAGPAAPLFPQDICIRQCYMMDIGTWEKQSAGINLSVAQKIQILHCTLHHSVRSCININEGAFGGHEIAYNDIFDAQTQTMDHGPFNSWGRDRFWSVPVYNGGGEYGEVMRHWPGPDGKIYDLALLDACHTTRIHHNRFYHAPKAPHTWGIDLDDGSSNYEIDHNLCLGMGIKLREGFCRRVHHNILIDGQLEIHVPYAQAEDEIYENLIVHPEPVHTVGVDAERFAKANIRLWKNSFYNFGALVILPDFLPCQEISQLQPFVDPEHGNFTLVQCKEDGPGPGLIRFGQENCASASPVYPKTGPLNRQGKTRREAWQGAFLSEVTEAILSATGSFGEEGIYFESVPANSPAAAMGFCSRDILKRLAGEPVRDLSDFYNKSSKLKQLSLVTAVVHRTNSLQKVVLNFQKGDF